MDQFKNKKSKTNRKFVFLTTGLSLGIFFGGTVFNICQGKFNNKLNAAEQKEGMATPLPAAPLPAGFKEAMERSFQQGAEWPDKVVLNNVSMKVEYNFNENLTNYAKNLLKQYRSDYTTVAVIDNETGRVLAAVGYEGKANSFNKNLIMTSTHPSASLIKMVTTAELLQNSQVKKETMFDFRGRSTTLFKYQLNESRSNRWDKTQNFETAFAKSNNVIFGKAAIKNTTSQGIVRMAEGFGFNQPIMKEFGFLKSEIHQATDDFSLAELASGYNIATVISPIHAAAMASVVANDGVFRTPKLISKIVDPKTGENIWPEISNDRRAISLETSKEMHEMMGMTVDDGTARRSFRKMNNSYRDVLDIGGKTGSITGGTPYGKRDWFAAFAMPREKSKGKGISISVMNVNVKKWHVKSSMLAKNIIEYYYKNINPIALGTSSDSKRAPSESRPAKKRRHHHRRSA
ncbi:MAG: penicillin-binding transpeptidase domain-containing protein [Bacteriovorax sp.]|nr:penicillin-binding transpeptidase domain-containing protein [Bacteriovorax sp.]